MRLSIGRVRPRFEVGETAADEVDRLRLRKASSAPASAARASRARATGLPSSRARTASTRSIAYAGSRPSRRAAMTLSEATWNSGASLAKVSASAHCAFSCASSRRASAGGSGSFFVPGDAALARRRWTSRIEQVELERERVAALQRIARDAGRGTSTRPGPRGSCRRGRSCGRRCSCARESRGPWRRASRPQVLARRAAEGPADRRGRRGIAPWAAASGQQRGEDAGEGSATREQALRGRRAGERMAKA